MAEVLFETTAEYAVLAMCVLGALTLLGLPVRVALVALAGTSMPVPTPLLGMSFAVVSGWYGYRFAGAVVPLFRIAGIVGAIVALAWVVLHRAELGGVAKAGLRRLAVPLSIAMGVGLVMMVGLGSVLSLSYPTVVSNPNNDIAAYALIGQHVADGEPGEEGSIEGYDAGLRSQSWDFGPLAILAASSSMGPSADVWRYQVPLLGVAVGLIAYMLAIYFRELLPGRTVLTTLAAISSVCGFLFTLVWSFYFLNQLLATGLVLGLVLLIARGAEQRSLRARVAFAIAGGGVLCGLIASYPHMAALGPAVLLPALFFARSVHGTMRRGVALVVEAIGVGIVALLLLPEPITRVPEAIREIATAEAGFSLPGFLPMEILGDLSTAAPLHRSPWEWAPSVVVLLALAASCVYLIRRQHAPELGRFAIVVFALALGTYGIVFLSQGPSYRQWKWITFYVPILCGTAVLVAAATITLLLSRWGKSLADDVAAAGVIAYGLLALSNSTVISFPLVKSVTPANSVPVELSTLASSPAFDDVDELNIDLGPYWESMWAAYFLRDHHLHLVQPTYYAVSSPTATWTLLRRDAPVPPGTVEVRLINGTYQLVR